MRILVRFTTCAGMTWRSTTGSRGEASGEWPPDGLECNLRSAPGGDFRISEIRDSPQRPPRVTSSTGAQVLANTTCPHRRPRWSPSAAALPLRQRGRPPPGPRGAGRLRPPVTMRGRTGSPMNRRVAASRQRSVGSRRRFNDLGEETSDRCRAALRFRSARG